MNATRQLTDQDKALIAGLFWQGWLIKGRPATWDDMTATEQARAEIEWRRSYVRYSEDQPRVPAEAPEKVPSSEAPKGAVYLTKYSEDQPRDDHGRWTSGGGGEGGKNESEAKPSGGGRPDAAPTGGTRFESEADFKASVDDESKKAKWNYGKVNLHEDDKTFELGGRQYYYAGAAHVDERDPQKGQIDLYRNQLTKETLPGVYAHEREHIKFQTALDAYGKESQKLLQDDRDVMRPSGEIRPGFEQDYPVHAAMGPYWLNPASDKKMEKADGVSDYSRAYWDEWKSGKMSRQRSYHETLAEMARIKNETGKLPGHSSWKGLYRAVDKVFKMQGGPG